MPQGVFHKIDPEANVMDMLRSWENGNRNEVIAALADDHPGLTAMFLSFGIKEKILNLAEFNTVVNLLSDKRVEMARSQGL